MTQGLRCLIRGREGVLVLLKQPKKKLKCKLIHLIKLKNKVICTFKPTITGSIFIHRKSQRVLIFLRTLLKWTKPATTTLQHTTLIHNLCLKMNLLREVKWPKMILAISLRNKIWEINMYLKFQQKLKKVRKDPAVQAPCQKIF